jgi:hypothetical protein
VAVLGAAYVLLGGLFAHETRAVGLLSPSGAPNLGVVVLGLAYLVVRVVTRFAVPAIAVYVLVTWALRAVTSRWR